MKNSIKIWPQLDDITPAIIPYSDSSLNPEQIIHIDMSNVKSINSSGAVLTLSKLTKIIGKYKDTRWSVVEPENSSISEFLETIGFNNILNSRTLNKDLLWTLKNKQTPCISEIKDKYGFKVTSYPIYYLDFYQKKHREVVEDFIDWILNILSEYSKIYNFRLNILVKALNEIAKNSEDHTNDNAFFGLDIIEDIQNNKARIVFAFCDLGIGIHQNIKNHIEFDKRYRKNASTKMGIVDSYHYAFTPGFTTSKSPKNKGIGMSMILDCVKILGIDLSFFDARSKGKIPDINSHTEIRRNFWNTGNPVGFYYYGKLYLDKK